MSDSDSSSLSSAPPTDDEKIAPIFLKAKANAKKVVKAPPTPPSPPRPKRSPSPPHVEVMADNPDIAFIVMFRSRFSAAFPPKLPHYGPQDIERGVVDSVPSAQVENLLCALLALVLNRKKPIERGHYGRAIEEAISTQKHQWPRSWNATNPLPGTKTFNDLDPAQRLDFLKTLILWSLTTSDVISTTIKDSYKQSRHEDDLNQPLSVQPWGVDGDKRRYWLIEGQDDTSFRVYREGNRALKNIHWWSVAGSIEECKAVAEKLEKENTQASRRLATRIHAAIPRFEATEEKRKRREYRQVRRAQFSRPEPGFSLYEGRTRGKRMRYTFSDGEEDDSDATSTRRSTRHSGHSTPADSGPVVTASGRQVRPRGGGMYGESLLSGQATNAEDTPMSGDFDGSETSDVLHDGHARATRSGGRSAAPLDGSRKRKHVDTYNSLDDMSDEDDAASSGNEWDGGDDEDVDDNLADEEDDDDDDAVSVVGDDLDEGPRSLIVKLQLNRRPPTQDNAHTPDTMTTTDAVRVDEEPLPSEMLAQLPALSHYAEHKSGIHGASVLSVVPNSSSVVASVSETTLEKPLTGEHPVSVQTQQPQNLAQNPGATNIAAPGYIPSSTTYQAATTTEYPAYVPPPPQQAQTNGWT
ncbi:hypothetical protein MBLNU459_g5795t1 [Dothideomycetes sp. NU459]